MVEGLRKERGVCLGKTRGVLDVNVEFVFVVKGCTRFDHWEVHGLREKVQLLVSLVVAIT